MQKNTQQPPITGGAQGPAWQSASANTVPQVTAMTGADHSRSPLSTSTGGQRTTKDMTGAAHQLGITGDA
jgi:hypothetical protein